MPQEEVIKCKIYRAEDGNNHEPQWERPGFKKDEIETRVKDVVMFRNNYLPNCYKLFVEVTYELPKKGRNEPLGISNRHGLVTRVNYASPFKGSILPGDVLLSVNGTNVCFEEKTIMGQVEDKTTSQQSKQKNPEKKGTGKEGEKKNAKPAFWTGAQEFKSVISKILASKKETKITITVARMGKYKERRCQYCWDRKAQTSMTRVPRKQAGRDKWICLLGKDFAANISGKDNVFVCRCHFEENSVTGRRSKCALPEFDLKGSGPLGIDEESIEDKGGADESDEEDSSDDSFGADTECSDYSPESEDEEEEEGNSDEEDVDDVIEYAIVDFGILLEALQFCRN
ncbi:hypothetical protein L5515_010484 [Caenorhabditis briggsae]|uniref:PDZ domain-containing protein n=1 Tax=Caenorhabditis briggsae TaxID=6238 RepID=A0AAE9EM75_CAEBR|nr:hypothetical protein L5515_010484 [Caenorhabditis briggsae]